ncbi:hypothetical protein [Vibrio owensii]|uniref:hypothetical protein n=1 Tax=Vibrio owensii TaxID=696485 RepID=UPI0040686865
MKLNHPYRVDEYDIKVTRYEYTYAGGVDGTGVTVIAMAPYQEYKIHLNGIDVDRLGLMGAVAQYIEQRQRWADSSSYESGKLKHSADFAVACFLQLLLQRLEKKLSK